MGMMVNLRSIKINPKGCFARVQTFTDADEVGAWPIVR